MYADRCIIASIQILHRESPNESFVEYYVIFFEDSVYLHPAPSTILFLHRRSCFTLQQPFEY